MLGQRIGMLRRLHGWSQAELARKLRVSPSAMGMYEQGRREPSLAVAVELSRVFEISVDLLLTGKPLTPADEQAVHQAVAASLRAMGQDPRRLSREELAVLFAAVMTEA